MNLSKKAVSILWGFLMNFKAYFLTHLKQFFTVATLVAFLAGCGADHSPLAPTDGTALTADQDGLTFSAETARAAKKAKKNTASLADGAATDSQPNPASGKVKDSRLISEVFGAKGGHITVQEGDLKITFTVPKNALSEATLIDMEVVGNTASDLEVRFGPSGLNFDKLCSLDIKLHGAAVDASFDELETMHVGGDGTEDQAGIVKFTGNSGQGSVRLVVEVPGFSRYLIRRSR